MSAYHVILSSPISKSYRCKRAADSLDIDQTKKSIHELMIDADLDTDYNLGVIVGASGSGKTSLAKKIFGEDCFKTFIDNDLPIIDQFPEDYDYDTCANLLCGIGLTHVPCWIRPVSTLSNGQRARAEAALLMINSNFNVIDEWTSVVDRTVAKIMSHCIQKYVRKHSKKIVLLSCHYDVLDWLNPDWIIDCNTQTYTDRRLVRRSFERTEKLKFDIRKIDRNSWKYFSKYHYLSEKLPGGKIFTFGLFSGENQIGFQCFANYVPHVKKQMKEIMHFNRTVIHPDYAGLGLGILLINRTSEIMLQAGYRVLGKFSSIPIYKSMSKQNCWRLLEIRRQIGKMQRGNIERQSGYRENIKTYSFEYIGQ